MKTTDVGAEVQPACVPVADRVISDAAGQSGRPSLAWNGDGYGVAWPDDRSGTSQIFFARLDRAGAQMGAQAPLTTGAAADAPNIVWSGDAYGVSWVDAYGAAAVPPYKIHFARVSAGGVLMGLISDMPGEGISSLVWTGTEYAAAYSAVRGDAGARPNIFVSRFDAAGARVGTETQLTENTEGTAYGPTIAWTGSNYGVAFNGARTGPGSQVFVGLLDRNGAEIGSEVPVTSGVSGSIAASPTGFAVTYSGEVLAAQKSLVRLDLDRNRTGMEVKTGGAPANLVWTGTRYAFAYSSYATGRVELATIDTTAPAASAPVAVSDTNAAATANAVALVWNGSGYGAVWRDERTTPAETHFAVVCPP